MALDSILENYPRKVTLKSGLACVLRPLESRDETAFYQFFQAVPEQERMFIKNRVADPAVIQEWCQHIDLGRNFPLLAIADDRIIGAATLHQQLGGWKRHIGRVSVLVHPDYRSRGLARTMVLEILDVARSFGLEKAEAEFIGEQEQALKIFGMIGFTTLVQLRDYVKDMRAISHDYILMGLNLTTDEEYAGMG
jgi:GNAT superfamily N-acetyltransferase